MAVIHTPYARDGIITQVAPTATHAITVTVDLTGPGHFNLYVYGFLDGHSEKILAGTIRSFNLVKDDALTVISCGDQDVTVT